MGCTVHDKVGRPWHFRLWIGFSDADRIYFWNDERNETGELQCIDRLNMRKIRQLMTKVAKVPDYGKQFRKPLSFPLERYHP
jgi:hypothetical protein